jgi:hypothetical protein
MSKLTITHMIEANRVFLRQRLRIIDLVRQREYLALGVVLFLTVLNGLIFTFVVPPWQHYDEPTNFEYAWLIANKPGWPQVGDYDASMRREVAASMIENKFFAPGAEPDLSVMEDPVWIGASQIEDRPFTYWVISLPLHLVKSRSVTNQLYVGRLVSIIFYILTVVSAWGIMREITPHGSSLRWVFPTVVAIMPGLSNLMTSLNSDSGAIGIFSIFLWGCIRLVKQGFSWLLFAAVSGLAILCLYTKVTVYLALPLLAIVVIFSFFRGENKKWAYILMISGLLAFGLITLTFDDAAHWYRSTTQTESVRARTGQANMGEYVFELNPQAQVYPSWHRPLFQPVLMADVKARRGNALTLGAWMWSTDPGGVAELTFSDGNNIYNKKIVLTTAPTFYAMETFIGETSTRAWVMLGARDNQDLQAERVYIDNVVLAEGERPTSEEPEFLDEKGNVGMWGGRQFTNLVRNSSAELGTVRFRPWFDSLWSTYLPYYSGPSFNLHYLLDYEGAQWHYKLTATRLFKTFWGQFGWGHVPLIFGPRPYTMLGIISILAIIGAILKLFRQRKVLAWAILLIMGIAALGVWVMAVMRGTSHLSVLWLYLPVARYAYPVIIPTLLVFTTGLLELLRFPGHYFRYPSNLNHFIIVAFMLILNVASITSIFNYYR